MQVELYTINNITVAEKKYIYQGLSLTTLTEEEIIEVNSSTNGLLVDSGQLFLTALDIMQFQQSLLSNSAIPTGILKSSARLTEKAIERLRESWSNLYRGTSNSGKTIILEEGLDYHPISMNPSEMDLTNSKESIISEICRVFNIPQSMIDTSANKYASNEQNSIQFLQTCIAPIMTSIESALDKNLLSESEKEEGFYFRFDTSELLRTTEIDKLLQLQKA